jgi:Domain of unknown function (DUF4037)
VFVAGEDVERVDVRLEAELPESYDGWPVRFGWDDTPVSKHVEVVELGSWLEQRLGLDARVGLSHRDWLTLPQQLLLEVTAGAVFHDGLGELAPLRDRLRWYPDDVWLWLLASQWRRLDQEEPLVGRTAEVDDELGSRVLAARLARDLIRLCFLLERRYGPYSKWLGTAFRQLAAYDAVAPSLAAALDADDFAAREAALVAAAQEVARRQNALGIARSVDTSAGLFHGRPFRVLGSGRFVDACLEQVADPWLRALPLVGGIDQLADSTDLLSHAAAARRAACIYDDEEGTA